MAEDKTKKNAQARPQAAPGDKTKPGVAAGSSPGKAAKPTAAPTAAAPSSEAGLGQGLGAARGPVAPGSDVGALGTATSGGATEPAGEEDIIANFIELSRDDMVQAIRRSVEIGNYGTALDRIEFVRARFGEHPDLINLRARVRFMQGQFAEAYELYKKIFFECPEFCLETNGFADASRGLFGEKLKAAQDLWQEAIRLAQPPDRPTGKKGQAPMPIGEEQRAAVSEVLERAILQYKEILAIEPMHKEALKGIVITCREMGLMHDLQKYQAHLQAATSYWNGLHERRNSKLMMMADRRLADDDAVGAIALINLGLDYVPESKALLLAKAQALRKLEKFSEAFSCIESILRLLPNDFDAMVVKREMQRERLGGLMKQGRLQLGVAEAPESDSLVRRNAIQKALDSFYQVLEIESENLEALQSIYRCHELSQDAGRAAKALDRIKQIDDGFNTDRLLKRQDHPPIQGGGTCFIAGRLFGAASWQVVALCRYRERILRPTLWGRAAIAGYETVSPLLVRWLPAGGRLEHLLWRALWRRARRLLGRP